MKRISVKVGGVIRIYKYIIYDCIIGVLVLFLIGCEKDGSSPTGPSTRDPYAKAVVSADIKCLREDLEANLNDVLGPPDFTIDYSKPKSSPDRYTGFLSLGIGGSVVVDMGIGTEIVDGPGDDLRIWQAVANETVIVYVSIDLKGLWYYLGKKSAPGYADFDLVSAGLKYARYVKIVDNDPPGSAACYETAGADIDAVEVLNMR